MDFAAQLPEYKNGGSNWTLTPLFNTNMTFDRKGLGFGLVTTNPGNCDFLGMNVPPFSEEDR